MIVFKGFNHDMTCTLGHGRFKYSIGKKATAKAAKTARTGLHSTKEPFGILRYYNDLDNDAFCICEAAGDINEDGNHRISSTELTPIKKITPQELAMYETVYIYKHPELECDVTHEEDRGNKYYAIARGKNPAGYGRRGTVVCLIQEYATTKNVKKIAMYEIDGKKCRMGWYTIGGWDEKRNVKKS